MGDEEWVKIKPHLKKGHKVPKEWREKIIKVLRCRKKPEIKLTIDHIIPTSEGGTN